MHIDCGAFSQAALVVKNPPAMAGDIRGVGLIPGFNPWVGKIPWRRKEQPTSVFSPRVPCTEDPGGPIDRGVAKNQT